MSVEDIINQILLSRPDLSRQEVLERIEERKTRAEGYLTDEAAARVIATDLGVKVPQRVFKTEILIKDVVSGVNDVTITGRIITVEPPHVFIRSDMSKGKVVHLLIADRTGTMKVLLWNDKTNLQKIGKLVQGEIIRVSHGYVRQGLDGNPELHVGLHGEIQVSPLNVRDDSYPKIADLVTQIAEVRKGGKASVRGTVLRVYPISTFERSNGSGGKVMRLQFGDGTGRMTAVFWNEKVDELSKIKKGDFLQILNGRTRESLNGQVELHVGRSAHVETSRASEKVRATDVTKEGGPRTTERRSPNNSRNT